MLLRVWGPRVEFAVRLVLVATFLDDSLRTATNFSEHATQVEQGGLRWLPHQGRPRAMPFCMHGYAFLHVRPRTARAKRGRRGSK